MRHFQQCGGLKNLGRAKSYDFLAHCILHSEEIIGAQNFNLVSKFSQNGGFSSKYCSFGLKFSEKFRATF